MGQFVGRSDSWITTAPARFVPKVLERYEEIKEATAADLPKVEEGLTVLRRALRARRQQAAEI